MLQPLLSIFLFGAALYGKVFWFGLVHFDDMAIFESLPAAAAQGADTQLNHQLFGLLRTVNAYHPLLHRPLLEPLFLFLRRLHAPLWAYYGINLFFHLAACLAFYLFLKRTGRQSRAALLPGLVFCAHPVAAQVVGWLPGCYESLLAVLVLLSFSCFLRFAGEASPRWLLGHMVCFFAALLTKETAVALPLVCLLHLVLFPPPRLRFSKGLLLCGGWLLLFLIWGVGRLITLGNVVAYSAPQLASAVKDNLPALIPYLGKALLPWHPAAWQLLKDAPWFDGLAAVLIVLLFFWRGKEGQRKQLLFGMGWFVLFLLPTFVRPASAGVYLLEYRLYVPLMGVLLGVFDSAAFGRLAMRRPALVVFSGLIAGLSVITWNHLEVFRSKNAFWEHAVAASPSSASHRNSLGVMYFLDGKLESAARLYYQALAINPKEPLANNNLGLVFMRQGKLSEAEAAYRQEMAVNPRFARVHVNLGNLYYLTHRVPEAEKEWQAALALDPDSADAHAILAEYYAKTGKTAQAVLHYAWLKSHGVAVLPEVEQKLAPMVGR